MPPAKLFTAATSNLIVLILGIHLVSLQEVPYLLWSPLAAIILNLLKSNPLTHLKQSLRQPLVITTVQLSLLFIAVYSVNRGRTLDGIFLHVVLFTFTLSCIYPLKLFTTTFTKSQLLGLLVLGFLALFSIPYVDSSLILCLATVLSFIGQSKENKLSFLILGGALFISSLLSERAYSYFLLNYRLAPGAPFSINYLHKSFGNLDFIVETEIKQPELVFDISGKLELKKLELYFQNSKIRQNISSLQYSALAEFIKDAHPQPFEKCLIASSEIGQLTAHLSAACKHLDLLTKSKSQEMLQKKYWANRYENYFQNIRRFPNNSFIPLNEADYDLIIQDCFDDDFDFRNSPRTVIYCPQPQLLTKLPQAAYYRQYTSALNDLLYLPKSLSPQKERSHIFKEVAPISN